MLNIFLSISDVGYGTLTKSKCIKIQWYLLPLSQDMESIEIPEQRSSTVYLSKRRQDKKSFKFLKNADSLALLPQTSSFRKHCLITERKNRNTCKTFILKNHTEMQNLYNNGKTY